MCRARRVAEANGGIQRKTSTKPMAMKRCKTNCVIVHYGVKGNGEQKGNSRYRSQGVGNSDM